VVTRRLLIVTASALMMVNAACSAGAPARHVSKTTRKRASLVATHRHRVALSGGVTLAFAGDVHFAGRVARLLKNPATAFGPISSVLGSSDFTALNLETAVTSRGQPQPKTYHFATRPGAFTALHDAGVDLVTIANNHILDFGQIGLEDTLAAARKAHFPLVGAGVNAEAAWAPFVTTINGTKIAIIGVSQVAELASSWAATAHRPGEANAINLGQTLAAVRAAKRLARIVVVFMHWGTEGMACPDENQLSLAPKLAAAGASIIIGAHAHVLQGSGWLGHTFVAYGLGNFLWWENSFSTATGVLRLTLHPHAPLTARFIPAIVSHTGQPITDQGAVARRALAHYASLRACAGLSASPPAAAITPTSAS
jgi:poly-gamma-glutamate capsule biosynthesis protein CapA/YwtB (metallophosphatase superfamily)